MLQCSRCATIFSSEIHVSDGKSITFEGGFHIQCPRCGSLESIPDGTFRETVEGIATLLHQSQNPLKEAVEILGTLEDSRRQGSVVPLQSMPWFTQYKQWLPDTPEKIAAYVGIFAFMYQTLMKDPGLRIEYSPTFIEQYNQTIIYEQPVRQLDSKRGRAGRHDKGFGQHSRK